jgi:hypothetical protein
MIAGYLAAERDLGRIAADADVDVYAAMLVGSAHLLYADRQVRPDAGALRSVVAWVIGTGGAVEGELS